MIKIMRTSKFVAVNLLLLLAQSKAATVGNVVINGPDVFVTDGSKKLTLECEATDVPSGSTYSWAPAWITCEEAAKDQGNCTFTPSLDQDNTTVHCTVTTPDGHASVGSYTLNLRQEAPTTTSGPVSGGVGVAAGLELIGATALVVFLVFNL